MGKEKELLKEILSNTQLIMKHLKIETAKDQASTNNAVKKLTKPEAIKPVVKKAVDKKVRNK